MYCFAINFQNGDNLKKCFHKMYAEKFLLITDYNFHMALFSCFKLGFFHDDVHIMF